ncbi:hypothetical protein TWF281_003693 [Arthrobotrys megalospora]
MSEYNLSQETMWQYRRRSQPLTPVREESISGASASTRPKSATNSPLRGNSLEMERIRSFISNVMKMRSQSRNGSNETIVGSLTAGRRPRFTGDGNEERELDSGVGLGEPSTAMASPVIGDAEKMIENQKFKKYRNYVFMAASMSTAVEGYAILLSTFLTTFLGMIENWNYSTKKPFQLSLNANILLKLSIFLGMPVGSVLAAILSRKFDEKNIALGFLGLIFIANLAVVLSGWGPGVSLYGTLAFWRCLVGTGIGGCRIVNALTSSRIATPKWRGARMGYVSANSVLGYCSLVLATVSGVWIFKPARDENWECGWQCKSSLYKIWRLVSGFLLLSTAMAIFACWNSSRMSPHPDDTSRVILKFSPSFGRFAKTYRSGKYVYPLIYICVIQFFAWASFYSVLLNLPSIVWEAGLIESSLRNGAISGYINRMNVGIVILLAGGVISGYFLLCLLVDVWGRRRLLLLANTLLIPVFIILGSLWEKMPTSGRVPLITFALTLLVAGPLGCGYIYATEAFPRIYRVWGFMIADVVGGVGAIVGIVSAECILAMFPEEYEDELITLKLGWRPFRYLWWFWVGCSAFGLLAAFGIVETARKEVGVIEGEIYGDWGRWDDRRRMRPEQGVMEAEVDQ